MRSERVACPILYVIYDLPYTIKFHGLIFCVFDWQENLWGINFCGHGSMVGTIVVGFAKYASYCGLVVEAYHENLYTSKTSICTVVGNHNENNCTQLHVTEA